MENLSCLNPAAWTRLEEVPAVIKSSLVYDNPFFLGDMDLLTQKKEMSFCGLN